MWVGGGPDRLGAVVGQCWVAFCVGLLLVRVSYVLVFWWVLGSLVLPMVPPLVSGVSAGEGVVASGLGVGGGAGVGVVVPGPGVERGRLGVTGCGRSPLLAAGLVGPPLRPCGFWQPCSPPGGGGCWVPVVWVCVCCVCGAGGACALVCGVRLWGSCRWRLWGCVLCARSGVCAVCWWCVWVPVLAYLGLVWRPCLVWGLCVVPPPPVSAVWFPAPPGWGLLVVCPLAVPFACPTPSVSFPCRLGRRFPCVLPGPSRLWWVGGGPCRRLGSLPLVFPRGGADACTPRQGVTLLYGPSICTRSVQMDLLRSQVLQPFPTPGSGTLWVAGESLRDRRVSCLPRWTVCPTRSPWLGPNRSTCRGECSWSGPLVTPPGRCHRGPLTNGPGRIPPYCVCSGGADTVTRGGPKPLRLGPLPASPVGPFRPAPLFAVRFAVVGVPSLWVGVVVAGGGGFRCSWLCGLCACRPLLCSWFAVGVCVCGAVQARVVSVLVCGAWFVVCGVRRWCVGGVVAGVWFGWSLATPGGGCCVLLPDTPGWVSLPVVVCGSPPLLAGVLLPAAACGVCCVVCGVVGPSPLLAEVPVCYSPPLLAGFRCLWWCAVPRHSWLGFRCRQWRVVCGVWCVVCGGGVLVGLWLVCGVVGPSPLLAEVPVCYSPPLLVGFRCRWWWAVLATPG